MNLKRAQFFSSRYFLVLFALHRATQLFARLSDESPTSSRARKKKGKTRHARAAGGKYTGKLEATNPLATADLDAELHLWMDILPR